MIFYHTSMGTINQFWLIYQRKCQTWRKSMFIILPWLMLKPLQDQQIQIQFDDQWIQQEVVWFYQAHNDKEWQFKKSTEHLVTSTAWEMKMFKLIISIMSGNGINADLQSSLTNWSFFKIIYLPLVINWIDYILTDHTVLMICSCNWRKC